MNLLARLPADPLQLSLREKLAQLMVVRIGSDLPPVRTVEQDEARVLELLATCPVGGLLVFNGRHGPTSETLAELQQASRVPLLVTTDVERGYGQQLRPFPLLPHAMAFDRLGRDAADAVRRFGELTAVAARRAGVHVVNAPVADVNTDPHNPIIATRAFSTEPARAAELVAAFVEGCAAGGALATAKHFPGHGNTHEDSHHALPTVAGSRAELLERELTPFRAAIAAGAPLVMTAHVRYPAFDDSERPATLSRPILTDLLRGELGFEGVVASDSLLMAGVRQQAASEGALCAAALLAGVDLLLDVENPAAALVEMERAVDDGRVPLARVDEALGRVMALKRRVLDPQRGADSPLASLSFAELEAATRELSDRVATAAIEVDDSSRHLPLDPARPLLAVLVNHYRSHIDPPEPPLAAALVQRFPLCEFIEIRGDEPAERFAELTALALAAEQVLAAIVVKPAAWYRFGLQAPANEWLTRLSTQRPVVVACSMGGQAAIDLALAHPERVTGLLLIGTAIRGAPYPDLTEGPTAELNASDSTSRFPAHADRDTYPFSI